MQAILKCVFHQFGLIINPTAIIAIKWSKPRIGCNKPVRTLAVPPTANAKSVEKKYNKAVENMYLFTLSPLLVHI
jgi:hypothetical protein